MSYIYELHHTILKINYVLPEKYYCAGVETRLCNNRPWDLSILHCEYECEIIRTYYNENLDKIVSVSHKRFIEKSLEDLIEAVRKWSIDKRNGNEQLTVSKSPITVRRDLND